MRKPIRLLLVLAIAFLLLPTLVVAPAESARPYCGSWWGSLPKVARGDPVVAPITNVRAGRHACFDRLVVDLSGRWRPTGSATWGRCAASRARRCPCVAARICGSRFGRPPTTPTTSLSTSRGSAPMSSESRATERSGRSGSWTVSRASAPSVCESAPGCPSACSSSAAPVMAAASSSTWHTAGRKRHRNGRLILRHHLSTDTNGAAPRRPGRGPQRPASRSPRHHSPLPSQRTVPGVPDAPTRRPLQPRMPRPSVT